MARRSLAQRRYDEQEKAVQAFSFGQRVHVKGGEKSDGIITGFDDFNVFVTLDSDGVEVMCSPNMLTPA